MRWPWKANPDDVRGRREAKELLDDVLADWPRIHEAVGPIREGRVRNHISERAFALRERGTR